MPGDLTSLKDKINAPAFPMSNESSIDALNHLVHINREAEEGLRTAASHVKNSELESLFDGYAKQHAAFAGQLEAEIEREGGEVRESGTMGKSVRRGWADLKSLVTGHSVHSLLVSCESGEESAERAYHDASDSIPKGQLHTLIAKHHEQIVGFKTRLSRLAAETKHGLEYPRNE